MAYTIEAEIALATHQAGTDKRVMLGVLAGDVIGTELDTVTASAALVPVVSDKTQRRMALECPGGANLNAGSIGTMQTLFLAEEPPYGAIIADFLEYNLGPGILGQVRRVLIGATIGGSLCLKLVPLFASYLAGATTDALGNIIQHCFSHYFPPTLFRIDIAHECSELRCPGIRIPYSRGEDIRAIPFC